MPLGSNQSGVVWIRQITTHWEHLGARRKKTKIKGGKMANSPWLRKRRIDGEEKKSNQNPDRLFSTLKIFLIKCLPDSFLSVDRQVNKSIPFCICIFVNSLVFVQKDENWSYGKNVNSQFVALDLRIPVTEAESIKHASIIVNRVVRIHTIAHPKHPQRAQTAHNRMVAVAAKEKRARWGYYWRLWWWFWWGDLRRQW